jgi:hypothetical protein
MRHRNHAERLLRTTWTQTQGSYENEEGRTCPTCRSDVLTDDAHSNQMARVRLAGHAAFREGVALRSVIFYESPVNLKE